MRVAEIFTSLQGEGLTSGYPTLFIRLAGCNLSCKYCDTPATNLPGKIMDIESILSIVKKSLVRMVCITGGEPLLQSDELLTLLIGITKLGKEITIETNGTINFKQYQPFASICMDIKCPCSGESSDSSLLQDITVKDSVKFVVDTMEDLIYAQNIICKQEIKGEIFFSPVFGADYHKIAEFILNENLPVRMQLQLHKFIGVQ